MNKILCLYLFLIFSHINVGLAQERTYSLTKQFTVEELKEDYNILKEALQDVQPSLYRYSHKKEMDMLLENGCSGISTPMTEMDFYRYLLPVIARVRNGHSKITPSSSYLNYTETSVKKFPLKIAIIDGHAYIKENYSADSSFIIGSEILSINGFSFYEIYAKIFPLMPSDGYSLSYKTAKLAANFHYHYAYHYPNSDSFELEVLPPNKQKSVWKKVDAATDAHIDQQIMDRRKQPYAFKQISDSIAMLTIRNFSAKNFKQFMDDAFEQLSKTQTEHLVIDLRDNRGGRDNFGVYLYSYLSKQPFTYYRRMETQLAPNQRVIKTQNYFRRPDFFNEFVTYISKDENLRNVIKAPKESFGFVKPGVVHPIQPNNYTGKVYILINEMSFSVTSDFCSIMHDNKRATFIGKETGGAYYGNTSGYAVRLVLPNTKLNVTLNLIAYYNDIKNERNPFGRGVIPDHEISLSQDDLHNGSDSVLAFTLDLIKA